MKLIICILHDNDYDGVSRGLIGAGYRVTRVASTGGFFRRGSSTLMIGVQDDKVDDTLEVIRKNTAPPTDEGARRATVFVLPIENFTQI